MAILELKRVAYTPHGTYGMLSYQGNPWVLTLELPWRDNKRNISCIPVGRYRIETIHSPQHGPTISLDVPGRSGIIVHAGNSIEDTRGCILVGLNLQRLWGVGNSQRAMDVFRRISFPNDNATITISD